MALNGSPADTIIRRRENIARLRLRGLSQREIVVMLAKLPEDPMTISVATVNRDLKILRAEWRANAAEAIEERKGRQLAEIDEAKRRAWADGDLQALARFLKLESDIFGTAAPLKLTEVPWRIEAKQYGIVPDTLVNDLFSKVPQVTSDAGDDPA